MAEGLLRSLVDSDEWQVYSAGTEPSSVRPEAVAVLKEIGIDISSHRSKSVDEFSGMVADHVLTVCDNAKENCPFFPATVKRSHRSFADPAAVEGSEELRMDAFRRVRNEISSYLESEFLRVTGAENKKRGM